MNQVILVSGPAGAGKSSVAEAICERFDRMLHVEVDTLRHWVKAGYRHPWDGSPQAGEQRLLSIRNACAIARNAVALRYAVVIDDPVRADDVEPYRDALEGLGCNVHYVLLLPDLVTALERDAARRDSIPDRVRALHESFTRESGSGSLPGAVIDSTRDEDAALTADRVLDAVAAGDALFLRGAAG